MIVAPILIHGAVWLESGGIHGRGWRHQDTFALVLLHTDWLLVLLILVLKQNTPSLAQRQYLWKIAEGLGRINRLLLLSHNLLYEYLYFFFLLWRRRRERWNQVVVAANTLCLLPWVVLLPLLFITFYIIKRSNDFLAQTCPIETTMAYLSDATRLNGESKLFVAMAFIKWSVLIGGCCWCHHTLMPSPWLTETEARFKLHAWSIIINFGSILNHSLELYLSWCQNIKLWTRQGPLVAIPLVFYKWLRLVRVLQHCLAVENLDWICVKILVCVIATIAIAQLLSPPIRHNYVAYAIILFSFSLLIQ